MISKTSLITPFEADIIKVISKLKNHRRTKGIFSVSLLDSLQELLKGLIQPIIQIAIIEEFRNQKSQGLSTGTTSDEEFNRFIKDLSGKDGKEAFLKKYPVIKELIRKQKEFFFKNTCELLERLQNDWEEINCYFFADDPIVEVRALRFLSESHGSGNRTISLTFLTKNMQLIECIYKPRSAKMDLTFQDLFLWIQKHTEVKFLFPKLIDKHDYSWSEFVKQSDGITDKKRIKNFYERLGALLAIFYACRGRDIHYENIIACGEYPVLVDYECFFGPDIFFDANKSFDSTVYDCMVLTNYSFLSHKFGRLDLSALSGHGGQICPSKHFVVNRDLTDDINYEYVNQITASKENIPKCKEVSVSPHKYRENFLNGFIAIYRLLNDYKEEFLTKIQSFEGIKIRVIPRSTMIYDQILELTKKPLYSQSKKTRKTFIEDVLKKGTQGIIQKQIFKSEVRDIKNLDIPYFYTYINQVKLYDSSSDIIKKVTFSSGIETTCAHIRKNINNNNLKKQICIINNSFDSLYHRNGIPLKPSHSSIKKRNNDNFSLVHMLDEIADMSLQNNSTITWPTIVHRVHPQGEIANVCFTSRDFYDGKVGVGVLFLYASVLVNRKYRDIAMKCFNECEFYESQNSTRLGFYGGVGGIVYALGKYSVLTSSSSYNPLMVKIIENADALIETEDIGDISYGIPGHLLTLLTARSHLSKKAIFTSSLEKSINRLIKVPIQSYNSVGFAHGMAGVIYTLLKAYKLTNNTQVMAWLIRNASPYMDALQKSECSQLKWCNGVLSNALVAHKVDSLLGHSLQNFTPNFFHFSSGIFLNLNECSKMQNFSLCHGLMGVLDGLMIAKEKNLMCDIAYREATKKMLCHFQRGEDLSYERGSIGLMTGKAGIAYQLLRQEYPDKVPSILFP